MKKLLTIVFTVFSLLCFSYSSVSAASYFSNNKALDSLFSKLEKTFAQYEKDEVIRPESMELIDDPSEKGDPWKTKKITAAQMKTAASKELNNIRVAIEIIEERLGGLSAQEYKLIEQHITDQLFFAKESTYGWDFDGKIVSLYVSWDERYDLYNFKGVAGNFARMGEEKDQVDPAALKVKDKITRYLNQSIQKGNKVSKKVLEKLPGEVEKLFIEYDLSKIEAARALADLHEDIYTPEGDSYDGTETMEELIESIDAGLYWVRVDRNVEIPIEFYKYPKDKPTSSEKEYITKSLIAGDLSKTFSYGFKNAITLDELAKLYFENEELDDKIVIEDSSISSDSPDYIKSAFVYGMIDDQSNLNKPLTRLEAAKKLMKAAINEQDGIWTNMPIVDYNKISWEDYKYVATCIIAGMKTRGDKFEPSSKYLKEEAIVDSIPIDFESIRGFGIRISLDEPSKVSVGKNTIHIMFKNKKEIKTYIEYYLDDTILDNIKLTGNYTKIDTGGVLIELYTTKNGIKFTLKNDVEYLNFEEGLYGPDLAYTLEPKVVKSTDKVSMKLQIDSRYKKLYAKLDPILAKIIKKGMTDKEKIKAIHDYVVKNITYDSKYTNEETLENLMISIDKGRGVCGDYSLFFLQLCLRANIPCQYEAEVFYMQHAWNAVYLNGKWLFVDTTWDDADEKKISYSYFLVDKYTFMKDHYPFMGIPEPKFYTDVDKWNIKSQEELRGYLLENFFWMDGYKLTFRMADKKTKPIITYMKDYDVKVILTYDAKKDLYTVTAKKK
ncbi:MAG: transglutaminase domain-containing protein [Mobilitalea sp.]